MRSFIKSLLLDQTNWELDFEKLAYFGLVHTRVRLCGQPILKYVDDDFKNENICDTIFYVFLTQCLNKLICTRKFGQALI